MIKLVFVFHAVVDIRFRLADKPFELASRQKDMVMNAGDRQYTGLVAVVAVRKLNSRLRVLQVPPLGPREREPFTGFRTNDRKVRKS